MAETFTTNAEEFDADDRISFSRLDQKFIAVHDDGSEFEFNADAKQWVPVDDLDDNAHEYGGESSSATPVDDPTSKKRKNGSEQPENSKLRQPKKQKAPPATKQNTAVYVTGLPLDVTIDEVHELFSQKCGVIAEEIDSRAPRIKLYRDSEGNPKGEALVVFFKPQSIDMAIMLLDDSYFRYTNGGTSEGRMRVQAADQSYKKVQYDQDGANDEKKSVEKSARHPQKSQKDRQKIIKKTQKLDAKLADWSDDESPYPAQGQAATKWDKTVILSHMFTLKELEEDPAALLEIKEDIRDECAKIGTVTNLVLFDLEAEGIVSVKFKEAESAQAAIKLMHGRSFDGRTVEAFLASGQEKFQKTSKEQPGDESE